MFWTARISFFARDIKDEFSSYGDILSTILSIILLVGGIKDAATAVTVGNALFPLDVVYRVISCGGYVETDHWRQAESERLVFLPSILQGPLVAIRWFEYLATLKKGGKKHWGKCLAVKGGRGRERFMKRDFRD